LLNASGLSEHVELLAKKTFSSHQRFLLIAHGMFSLRCTLALYNIYGRIILGKSIYTT
jgi:hypothetical protein